MPALCAIVLISAVLASPGVAAPPAAARQVDMVYNTFRPAEVTVNIGETVEWVNQDTVAHDVTFESGPSSGAAGGMGPGARWSYAFTSPGSFRYRCQVHSTGYDPGQGQVGRVTVIDPNAPPSAGGGVDALWIAIALGVVATIIILAWLGRKRGESAAERRRAERARRKRRR